MYSYSATAQHKDKPWESIDIYLGEFGSNQVSLSNIMDIPEFREILEETIPPDYYVASVSWELDPSIPKLGEEIWQHQMLSS